MKKQRRQTIRQKLGIAFMCIIVCIMSITVILHLRTTDAIRDSIYDRMLANVTYYKQNLDNELQRIMDLQLDFFQDRNLPFLAGQDSMLNAYEKREAYLSVQERMRTITGISPLVESGTLYFPKTGYRITDNRIGEMSAAEATDMKAHLERNDTSLHYDGEHFCVVGTGEARQHFSSNPNYVFVLGFSSEEIVNQLALLNEGNSGGTFIYHEESGVLLESHTGDVGGDLIYHALEQNEGEFPTTQRVSAGNQNYLVLVSRSEKLGIFVQYTLERSVTHWIIDSWIYTGLFLLAMILFSLFFIWYVQRKVHKPLNKLVGAFASVEQGEFTEHIYHDSTDEFSYLYESFNEMKDRLRKLIDEVYVQKNLAQRAQLKQLQAQINPHFLYNSFFILSRRIHREDIEGAEALSKHLGNYFKYLSRDQKDDIPLAQEVEHAKSYAAVQAARFAGRMTIEFDELPRGWVDMQVPRLILQPLLENAFKYGLENKAENALLKISFNETENRLRITVEDNGEEASDADIAAMQDALTVQDAQIISGSANIHRRLGIYFDGEAGLTIGRSSLGGVAVTIELPKREEEGA